MKTRKEIQHELLDSILNDMCKNNKKWDDIAVFSPKKGKIHGLIVKCIYQLSKTNALKTVIITWLILWFVIINGKRKINKMVLYS